MSAQLSRRRARITRPQSHAQVSLTEAVSICGLFSNETCDVAYWNFAVVHAYGRPEVMNDKDWLLRHVTELTAQQESSEAKPWVPSDAPASYIEVMLRGIVGFRFAATRLERKWKMNQNREMQDQVGVVNGLNKRGDGDNLEIAQVILRQIKPTS
jgi:predicted FMN-binding regulatory protein PaiB